MQQFHTHSHILSDVEIHYYQGNRTRRVRRGVSGYRKLFAENCGHQEDLSKRIYDRRIQNGGVAVLSENRQTSKCRDSI